MEGPTIPKAVLDNLLASMGSSALVKEAAAPYGRPNNGYAPLPVPLFHGANLRPTAMVPPTTVPLKNSGVSLPPLPGFSQRRETCPSPPSALFKDCADPSVGKGSAILPSPVKEKPKRVRKSRAGTTPRKRGISDLVLDASTGGATQPPPPPPQASPPKRRRISAKSTDDADKGEKPPPRKRNRTRSKAKDEHAWSSSTNETSFSNSRSDTNPPNGSLGVHELEAKPPDPTCYMKEISLEGLMAGDFSMPSLPRKQGLPPGRMVDSLFGSQASSILQNLTRYSSADQSMQQAALLSKSTESKPLKFSVDLKSTPVDGAGGESMGGTFCENGRSPPCYEAPTIFSQSRKTQERASLFPLEAVPAIPPADFWNTLQINPNVSLNYLITQASTNFDSRFLPVEAGSSCDKRPSTLPPSIFSLGSKQGPQESTCDRLASSKLNHWFSAEAPKQTLPDALPALPVLLSQSGKFPFKLFTENSCVESGPPPKPAEKSMFKEGLFDIDLNKQSPEAEAAETVAHSTNIDVPKPEVTKVSPHITVQAKIEMGSIDGASSESKDKGSDLDDVVSVKEAMVPVNEAENPCITESVTHGDVVGHMENKVPISLEGGELARRSQGSSLLFVDRKENSEQVKDTCTKASVNSLTVSVPDAPETEEICCDDVPDSPGMQAAARLLCRMAISSSPFYVEDGDKDEGNAHATVSCNDVSLEHPANAATVAAGCVEKDGRAQKCPATEEEHKALAKDVREKYLPSQVTSSRMVAEKEPWAWTPPRHPPKHVTSRVSGSQSSESERSHGYGPPDRTSNGHGHGPRDRTSNGNHGITNKTMQRDHQHGGVTTFSRSSSSFTIKEPKGNHTSVPKTSLLHALPIKGSSVLTPKKSVAGEAKNFSMPRGEGSTKISRPRSNMSKNLSQMQQRSLNGFPVQPRNLNGCSKKSPTSRLALPFVGEVRNGSK